MSDGAHLLIPFASCLAPGSGEALRSTPLPHLASLLTRLVPGEKPPGDEHSLSMPHERLLATLLGLPTVDGLIPWAAREASHERLGGADGAWAWITPCHWRVGTDHVAMDVVADLSVDEQQSRTCLEAMRPYFAEDGIDLHYVAPTRWLARGDLFRQLPAASLDRVEGRVIDPWMPRTAGAAPLRRLQQEMQMLLYTHPLNEDRIARGLLPITSFWASGTGALGTDSAASTAPPRIAEALRQPALHEDWAAWASAWREIDATECAALVQTLRTGAPVQLSLCGERSARTWTSEGAGGLMRRLGGMIAPVKPADVLEAL
ncbi:phosphoglycerate mutase [Caenimonas aquaedulcis]|uniref:Phosphoglycerate mutase n=1 Tax=Caenimonas aquaedulcis TaxID=2793270 RepID=A0A931H437_9BURK|nr:phosphoglycerate mutase [Caenimonas aquaedulcis]MBG9388254.1 phosphoglycerate mutase [Caenimonas aquaedulcis]